MKDGDAVVIATPEKHAVRGGGGISQTVQQMTARPNLFPLLDKGPETVAHLILAEIGGATWEYGKPAGRRERWYLAGEDTDLVVFWHDDGDVHAEGQASLPRPLHDDGDAWRLMVREGLYAYAPTEHNPRWWFATDYERSTWIAHDEPRAGCVLAALHKHADHPRWADLIPSVIARLEQAQ